MREGGSYIKKDKEAGAELVQRTKPLDPNKAQVEKKISAGSEQSSKTVTENGA